MIAIAIDGPGGAGTVSYTHLDVYKRQEQLGAIVSNVMFLGLPEMQRAILFEKEKEKHV